MSFSKTCLVSSVSAPTPKRASRRFINVDFPALVYPTKATLDNSFVVRLAERVDVPLDNSASSWRIRTIWDVIRRRDSSSFVSPEPRDVKPPPPAPVCWSRLTDILVRKRGSWYCRRANCTCNLASLVWARWAKMSKINPVRSSTVVLVNFSKLRIWDGDNSSLATIISTS